MNKRWSDDLYKLSKAHQTRGKVSPRTNAIRTNCGLHNHRSGAEAECCNYLQFLQRAKVLKIIKVEPNIRVSKAQKLIIPDWLLEYPDRGLIYADYKGFETDSFKVNRRLWKSYGPAPMDVWRKKGGRFFVYETIEVKVDDSPE